MSASSLFFLLLYFTHFILSVEAGCRGHVKALRLGVKPRSSVNYCHHGHQNSLFAYPETEWTCEITSFEHVFCSVQSALL